MDKNTTDLIQKLKGDLKPVKPLAPPILRWSLWFGLSILSVVLLMSWVQPFHFSPLDLFNEPLFLLETVLAFAGTVTCAYLAYLMCLPGRNVGRSLVFFATLPLILFLGMVVTGASGHAESMAGKRGFCDLEVLFFSWVPIAVMLFQLKKGYPFFAKRAGFLVGLAGTAFPLALMQLACMYSARHVLVAHVLPVILVVFAVVIVAHFTLGSSSGSSLGSRKRLQ